MNENTIVGSILAIAGLIYLIRPDWALRFQVWTQRKIMGARYIPTARTAAIVRIVGVLLLIVAFFALTDRID